MLTTKTNEIKNNLKYLKAKIITVGEYNVISKLSVSGEFLRFFQYLVEVALLWIIPWYFLLPSQRLVKLKILTMVPVTCIYFYYHCTHCSIL